MRNETNSRLRSGAATVSSIEQMTTVTVLLVLVGSLRRQLQLFVHLVE